MPQLNQFLQDLYLRWQYWRYSVKIQIEVVTVLQLEWNAKIGRGVAQTLKYRETRKCSKKVVSVPDC